MCLICERIRQIKEGTNPCFVKELETGYVVIGDHQHFKGYTLFLCKEHVRELYDLPDDFRTRHLQEMTLVAKAVSKAFQCEKMNYECLGNGDSHVHWHLFPRNTGDIEDDGNCGKGPVWWYPREKMFADENKPDSKELEEMKQKLREQIEVLYQ